MSGFTFGLNAPTIGISICIVILIVSSLVGAFFLGKQASNKKSNETTSWNSTNYEILRNKINLIMKSQGIIENFSSPDAPSLLDVVTNILTLENNPKIMDKSDFNDKVKQVIMDTKYLMELRKTDPMIRDPDPGPPVWTAEHIKKIKKNVEMFMSLQDPNQLTKEGRYPPTDKQLDCIITKIIANFKNPRDMKEMSMDEGFGLLQKCAKDCNYNWVPPTGPPDKIIWDDANLQKLKSRIISLSDDRSISLSDMSLFDCLTGKIINYYDSEFILDDTKFKPLVNQLIQECKGNRPISGGGWTKVAIDQIKIDIKNSLVQMLGKDPTNEQLDCIVNKIVARFKSPSEMASQEGMALMQNFFSECVSSWTPETLKQTKDTISTQLSRIGEKITEAELNCLVDTIKRLYTPNNMQDLAAIVTGIFPTCTGRKLVLSR